MVDFSGSFGFHVPLALYVPVFFEGGEHGVYGAGSEVYAEGFADFGDDLVAVHGLLVKELKDYHVEESFGEFGLDFFLVVGGHLFFLLVYFCCACVQYVSDRTYLTSLYSLKGGYKG